MTLHFKHYDHITYSSGWIIMTTPLIYSNTAFTLIEQSYINRWWRHLYLGKGEGKDWGLAWWCHDSAVSWRPKRSQPTGKNSPPPTRLAISPYCITAYKSLPHCFSKNTVTVLLEYLDLKDRQGTERTHSSEPQKAQSYQWICYCGVKCSFVWPLRGTR